MDTVFRIINQISLTSSRLDKEKILERTKRDNLLKKVLQFVYDPFIITGINKKKINKKIKIPKNSKIISFDNFDDVILYLKENNTGKDIDVLVVQNFINKQESYIQEFYREIFTKNLKIGVSAKTLNKVYGKGFIPEFSVMLAEPFERFFNNIACEVKVDGTRALAIKQGNSVNLFTRNGKLLEGFNDIIEQIKKLPVTTMVFDGELIGDDYTDTMNKLFRKSNNKKANYMIFDMLALDEFRKGESLVDYWTRKQGLILLFKYLPNRTDYFNLIVVEPLKILKNPTVNDINEVTQNAIDLGFEGIMVKPLDSKYECKRSYAWQKAKLFFSDEFRIIDFVEGDGKYKGTLGKVIIDVNGISVGLGSGWSDSQRNEIWNNKEEYINKYVEVQYQEIIKKSGSLRFPTVKGLRLDK